MNSLPSVLRAVAALLVRAADELEKCGSDRDTMTAVAVEFGNILSEDQL